MSSYLTFHDFSIHLMNRSLNVSFYTTSFISKKNLLIGNQRAKWEYIERLYKVDGFGGRARSTKLTEKHINPTSYDKMKVISKHERCGMMQAIDNVIYEHIKNNSPRMGASCGHPRSNMMEIGTKTIKNHMVKFAAQVFSRQVATSLEIQMKSLLSPGS
ncbi:uncharacterized protein LOC119193143 [Manduca sexta]|uniref:uncharacterized protein LOC119193143 n=1 Tax=Manduca sexta TaxID=7130 RepID=UPI00188F6F85|nr:uncharacterized protein LOC119193143 [Manduca sexta]